MKHFLEWKPEGVNSSMNDDSITPLHIAAYHDSEEICDYFLQILIQNGANVNARAKNGWTPLHDAACKNLLEKADLLIENGADINSEHENRLTQLHLSVCEGHIKMSKLLIENGANANALDSRAYSPLIVAVHFNQIETAH